MKTYIWSVHDIDGTMMQHGEITLASEDDLVDIITEIENDFSINISHYHEFRVKDKIQ